MKKIIFLIGIILFGCIGNETQSKEIPCNEVECMRMRSNYTIMGEGKTAMGCYIDYQTGWGDCEYLFPELQPKLLNSYKEKGFKIENWTDKIVISTTGCWTMARKENGTTILYHSPKGSCAITLSNNTNFTTTYYIEDVGYQR